MNDMKRGQGFVRLSPEDQQGARGGAGARGRAALSLCPSTPPTGRCFVRPGRGASTGRALPRLPAPLVGLLMLVHFLTRGAMQAFRTAFPRCGHGLVALLCCAGGVSAASASSIGVGAGCSGCTRPVAKANIANQEADTSAGDIGPLVQMLDVPSRAFDPDYHETAARAVKALYQLSLRNSERAAANHESNKGELMLLADSEDARSDRKSRASGRHPLDQGNGPPP